MTAAMSTAERQRRWREKNLKNPEGANLVEVRVAVEPEAAENLDFIQAETGLSKRKSVELAINQCAEALKKEATE